MTANGPRAAGPSVAHRALASTAVAAAVVVALLFVWHARDVLLLGFAGVLFAVFLRRLASWVSDRTPLTARWALMVVVLALLGSLVGTFALRGESIASEVGTLREQLPAAADQLRKRLERYEWGRRAVESLPETGDLIPDNPDAIARISGAVSTTFTGLASLLIILFLGVVLAATPHIYMNGLLALLPERKVPRGREVLCRLYDTLWWWLIGRIVSMTFIGVITGIGLWVIGIPLAFVLGIIAALLSFIPNIGPILSAIPAVLLALAQGPRQAIWVVALYIGVQIVESYVLAPVIDRKTVYLPPALTVLAQLVFALFAGGLGLALATPAIAAVVVLVTMLYVQDVLGRRDIAVASH